MVKNNISNKVILALVLLSFSSYAKIPFFAFKNVTKSFLPEKEYLSPTFGSIMLESGLLYNLRFYSNFEAGKNHSEDKSEDPVWNLVKLLFPSPGGNLSAERQRDINFGHHTNRPEVISELLNYSHKIRQNENNKNIKRDAFIKVASNMINLDEFQNVLILQDGINDFYKEKSPVFKNLEELSKNPKKKLDYQNGMVELAKELKLSPAFKARKFDNQVFNNAIKGLLADKSVDVLWVFADYLMKGKATAIHQILDSIEKSIKEEDKNKLYPKYTTESLINAFFCELFNTQEDIWKLLQDLDNDIVDKNSLKEVKDSGPLAISDVAEIASQEIYTIDTLFTYAIQNSFYANTPYLLQKPTSNGDTYPFDNKTQDFNRQIDFQDCVEVTIRHIASLLFYDAKTLSYDLTSLDEVKTTHSKELMNFFKRYSPLQANNGDISVRSDWSKIVSHLGDEILYNRDGYNLKAGFFNIAKVFSKLLGLTFSSPEEAKDKEIWIKETFSTIFKTLNNNRHYEIKILNGAALGKEYYGRLEVTIFEKSTKLFTFTALEREGHSYIESLEDSIKEKSKEDNFDKKKIRNLRDKYEIIYSLPQYKKNRKAKDPFLYLLINHLNHDQERICFFQRLRNIQEKRQLSDKNSNRAVNRALTHVLKSVTWDDRQTCQKTNEEIKKLLLDEKSENFEETLINGLQKLVVEKPEDYLLTQKFNKTPIVVFKGTSPIVYVDMNWIQELQLEDSNLKSFKGLNKFKNLRKLSLKNTGIDAIKFFEQNDKLDVLEIHDSQSLTRIEGMQHLKNLRVVNIKHANLENMDFYPSNEKIEEIDITSKKLQQLKGISHLKNLLHITLIDVKKLNELFFSQENKNIKTLVVKNSSMSKIENIDQLESLEELDLTDIKEIDSLELSAAFKNLRCVKLSHNAKLKKLTLSNVVNPQNINIDGLFSCPQLQTIMLKKGINLSAIKWTE